MHDALFLVIFCKFKQFNEMCWNRFINLVSNPPLKSCIWIEKRRSSQTFLMQFIVNFPPILSLNLILWSWTDYAWTFWSSIPLIYTYKKTGNHFCHLENPAIRKKKRKLNRSISLSIFYYHPSVCNCLKNEYSFWK